MTAAKRIKQTVVLCTEYIFLYLSSSDKELNHLCSSQQHLYLKEEKHALSYNRLAEAIPTAVIKSESLKHSRLYSSSSDTDEHTLTRLSHAAHWIFRIRCSERAQLGVTHVLEGDDVGMLSVSQQDLHLLRRVFLGLVDDLWTAV